MANLSSQTRVKGWKTHFELTQCFGDAVAKDMVAYKSKTKGMTRKDPNCPTHVQYEVLIDEELNKRETETTSSIELSMEHQDVSVETAAHLAELTRRTQGSRGSGCNSWLRIGFAGLP